jgi:hypothetical protein
MSLLVNLLLASSPECVMSSATGKVLSLAEMM